MMPRDWQEHWSTYGTKMDILPTLDTISVPVTREEFEQLKREIQEIKKYLHTHRE